MKSNGSSVSSRCIALVAFATVVVLAGFVPHFERRPASADFSNTSRFVPLGAPCRLADSRVGDNTVEVSDNTYRLSTAGRCDLPTDMSAVSVTVVGVAHDAAGFVVLYEAGTDRPTVSHVNVAPGETRANGAIVSVDGGSAAIDAHAYNGVDVVVDVTGYFTWSGSSRSGRFVAVPQRRLLDTRIHHGVVTPGTRRNVALPDGVPHDATALIVNVTATDTTAPGFLSVSPAGEDPGGASSLNWDGAGQTRAASAIVAINSSGFDVHVSLSNIHLVVDVTGYMTGSSAAHENDGLYVAETPRRLLDTRSTSPLGEGVPLYPAGVVQLTVGATGTSAAVTNVTMIAAEPGFLVATPAGVAPSGSVSSVNSTGDGNPVANMAVTPVSNRGVEIETLWTSHVIVDYFGRFTGDPVRATRPPVGNTPPTGQSLYPYGRCDTIASGAPGLNDVTRVPAEYRRIGTSVQGRPIWAEYWGPSGATTQAIVVAHVHGDECSAAALVQTIRQRPPTDFGVWVIPALNVDGYVNHTRENANGIDLNRDGLSWTQPETQALMNFTAEVQPTLSVHAHSPYGWVGFFGSSGDPNRGAWDAPLSYPIASQIASALRWPMYGAGERPDDEALLWQGQRRVAPDTESILVEFAPTSDLEAPTIAKRAPVKPFWWAALQSQAILDVLDRHL